MPFLLVDSYSLESSYAGSHNMLFINPESDSINFSYGLLSCTFASDTGWQWNNQISSTTTTHVQFISKYPTNPLIWRIPTLHQCQFLQLVVDSFWCLICARLVLMLLALNYELMQIHHSLGPSKTNKLPTVPIISWIGKTLKFSVNCSSIRDLLYLANLE